MEKVSRQLSWQRKMKALGRCEICGQKAINGHLCSTHKEHHRVNARNLYRKKHGISLRAPVRMRSR